MKIRVLGIDPGLVQTGWGVIDIVDRKSVYVASGVIKTDSSHELPARMLIIHQGIQLIIDQLNPTVSAIEKTYVNKNFESSLKLAHARAAAMLSLAIGQLNIVEYQAKTVKNSVVGSGNAEKQQVQAMISILLNKKVAWNNNEADALAVAICHAHHI